MIRTRLLAPALAFGLMLAALVTALGHISGCHLNPAVTLGLTATRKFPLSHVPAYLFAQFAGAILAALTVWAAYGAPARDQVGLGAPAPAAGAGILRTGLVEAVITFLLVLVIVSVATDDRVPAAAAGLAVGFALFAAISIGIVATYLAVFQPALIGRDRALGLLGLLGLDVGAHEHGAQLKVAGPLGDGLFECVGRLVGRPERDVRGQQSL